MGNVSYTVGVTAELFVQSARRMPPSDMGAHFADEGSSRRVYADMPRVVIQGDAIFANDFENRPRAGKLRA